MLVGVSCCGGRAGGGAPAVCSKEHQHSPFPTPRAWDKSSCCLSRPSLCRRERGAHPTSRPPLHSPAGEGHRAGGVAAIAPRRLESGPALPRGRGARGQEAAARHAPIGQPCSDAKDRRRAIGCGLLRPQPASGPRRGRVPAHFRGLTEVLRSLGSAAVVPRASRASRAPGAEAAAHGPQSPGTWSVAP